MTEPARRQWAGSDDRHQFEPAVMEERGDVVAERRRPPERQEPDLHPGRQERFPGFFGAASSTASSMPSMSIFRWSTGPRPGIGKRIVEGSRLDRDRRRGVEIEGAWRSVRRWPGSGSGASPIRGSVGMLSVRGAVFGADRHRFDPRTPPAAIRHFRQPVEGGAVRFEAHGVDGKRDRRQIVLKPAARPDIGEDERIFGPRSGRRRRRRNRLAGIESSMTVAVPRSGWFHPEGKCTIHRARPSHPTAFRPPHEQEDTLAGPQVRRVGGR